MKTVFDPKKELKKLINEMEGVNEEILGRFLGIDALQLMDFMNNINSIPEAALLGIEYLSFAWDIAKKRNNTLVLKEGNLTPEMIKTFVIKERFLHPMAYARLGFLLSIEAN